MFSFLAYLVAAVFLFCAAVGADFGPDRLIEWGLTLIAVGLAIQSGPAAAGRWRQARP